MREPERVLAIDPGRDKCGIAVVDRTLGVLQRSIVSARQLMHSVEQWSKQFSCPVVIVGNKTACQQVLDSLAMLQIENKVGSIVTVDEHNSTQEARGRYWQANPPRGWRKLLPIGLLPPPCAIDDIAAIILAERYFDQNAKNL